MITTEFTGENGQRWCPDCRKGAWELKNVLLCGCHSSTSISDLLLRFCTADPIIYAALDKKKDAILLEAPVARNDYKGNPEYIYRTHPLIAVTAVPTLIHHKTTDATLALTVNKRLVEAECYDQAKVNEFFGLE